ncbi:hypothetical protein [Hymenobacter siberiensis]|uniref:hypothetical protein n=1 Tax=Hymenobacter siberiensis TaxID=2848396 RepID=UPI001C1E7978|nr:hypothetical protein [Hymenobacter siberiensis]
MIKALLAGTKTQTRRLIKPKKGDGTFDVVHDGEGNITDIQAKNEHGEHIGTVRCPYGQPGDRLWVRETLTDLGGDGTWYYAADKEPLALDDYTGILMSEKPTIPSIFMPRVASRILLDIVEVRAERVQSITEADAVAEGILYFGRDQRPGGQDRYKHYGKYKNPSAEPIHAAFNGVLAKKSYETLWASINGDESWDSNPWCWVVKFRRVEA